MAILRFELNKPLEVALKYDTGKQVPSRIAGAPDQVLFTLAGDDTLYVPLHVADQIGQLGIKRMELMRITKSVANGVTRWTVERISDAAGPSSPLEEKLAQSITQARSRQQTPAKETAGPAPVASKHETAEITAAPSSSNHTHMSRAMAAALCAAIDAATEAEVYAERKGMKLEFLAEDLRALAATIFIQLARTAPLAAEPVARVNGGAQWPH